MRILVVDDEAAIRFTVLELLADAGHAVRAVEHAPAALAALEAESADLVFSDLSMPAMTGLQLLEEVRSRFPDTLFVLMTAHGDERTAVAALKNGAFDYLPKPFDNAELRAIADRARELLSLRSENARLREELATEYRGLIGSAPVMREVYRLLRRAGSTDVTVLLTGESGTGKELAAHALHEESTRRRGPFVAINCSAIPAELIESELFGHVRGAFTGADRDRVGVFEAASGGTLFLDEVGELSEGAQARLLRALEDRRITRVGASHSIAVDVRVVAATNRQLEQMVRERTFRDDLLYRLAVVQIALPPLRERRQDIMPLATHFTAHFAARHRVPPRALAEPARRALLAHDWPGNVRELRNTIERALVLGEAQLIELADLPPSIAGSAASLRPADAALAELPYMLARERALDAFDRSFLTAALERHGGNISATARALGLHRQSLQKVLRRLGINPSDD